jgi:LuxR family maltose regulon positive regulatory protein
VCDYLRDELLAQLAPAQVAFLTRVSPLGTLSGPLCDAVLGSHGSGVVLRELARSNVLLSSLDRSEEQFRCHTLLAEALRTELRRSEPEREAEIHRRASDWYDAHGEAGCAIDHAIAAGDTARAGALIWRLTPAYAACGGAATVARWLGCFTGDDMARHPDLALAAATVHLVRGERDMVERWGRIAEALVDAAPARRRDDLEAGVAIMRAAVARDGIARMRADAARAYALEPEDSPWRALCCLLMGAADTLSGRGAAGRALLEEGSRRGAMNAPAVQVLCLALLGLLALMEEQWDDGARVAELARAQVERVGLRDDAASALVYAVSALAGAHRARADAARDDVRSARRLLTMVRDFTPFVEGATTLALARAELRLGDATAARMLLDDCERVGRAMVDAPLLQAWLDDAWRRADAFVHAAVAGPSAITTAELRVLHHLPSHLPLREIAAELGVSANTVKTQAHALYRKLDASSRSEAVERATLLGLLDT